MVIDYSIEGKEPLNLNEFTIKGGNNEKLMALISWGEPNNNNNNKGERRGTIEITMGEGEEFPESIILTITGVKNKSDNKEKSIEGNWDFLINLNKDLIQDKGEIVNCNKQVSIDNYKFEIKNIRMYPTIAYVRVKLDPNYKFNAFKEPYLMDDKGIKYNLKGWSILNDNLIDMEFESGYFNKIKEISFNASGVYFMSKEDKFLNIDIENKKLINTSGYGVKLLDISYDSERNEENITLEVTDEKVLAEKEDKSSNSIDLENECYDENGKKINVSVGHCHSEKENPYILIMIPKQYEMPKQIKIKIGSVYSGNMGDIKIKLN